jgi:serine/threonine protein kinase
VAHISTSGLPSATAPAHIAGTLPYMAPERLQGQPISDKCDVYSLGVILWECLARRKPWHGLDKLSIIYQVRLPAPHFWLTIVDGQLGVPVGAPACQQSSCRGSTCHIADCIHACACCRHG